MKLSKSMIQEMVREALDTKYDKDLNEIAGMQGAANRMQSAYNSASDSEFSIEELYRSVNALAEVVSTLDDRVKKLEQAVMS